MIERADAHRDNGKRFIVHADEKLTAFIELDSLRKKVADEKQQKGKMRSLEPIKP
jgi:hypothetical protein